MSRELKAITFDSFRVELQNKYLAISFCLGEYVDTKFSFLGPFLHKDQIL